MVSRKESERPEFRRIIKEIDGNISGRHGQELGRDPLLLHEPKSPIIV
jgi:hypothetical protein